MGQVLAGKSSPFNSKVHDTNACQTEDSAHVLENHSEGWFGEHATKDVMEVANKPLKTDHKFEDMFVCDPSKKYYGYKSWDGKYRTPTLLSLQIR